jgi:uncharacterized membrane protein (UPF0127 family)
MARSSTSRSGAAGPFASPAALVVGLAAVAAIALMLFLGSTGEASACPEGEECVVIHTSSGAHVFTVEWAIEPAERSCGLMFREEMAADHSMVFDFQTERPVSFWMRNTYISLDMVFIRDGGEVLNVATNTTTLSDESVPSAGSVRYVLELVAGTAERIGLAPGDVIDLDRADGMTAGTAVCFPEI